MPLEGTPILRCRKFSGQLIDRRPDHRFVRSLEPELTDERPVVSLKVQDTRLEPRRDDRDFQPTWRPL